MWRLHGGGTYLVAMMAMEMSSSLSWLHGVVAVVVVVRGGDHRHWAVMVVSVDD